MNIFSWNSFGFTPFVFAGIGILTAVIVIGIVVLKGYALWNAAKRDEKWWFIALLVINTLGVLELIYLLFVVKKWRKIPSNV
ncbi:MAG: DUF5652 family protein [Candidatus Paceibacterota bacterium]|jgi:methionyl-tRNA synthetase